MSHLANASETERLEDQLVKRLCETLSSYLEPEQVNECLRAYHFGASAHANQQRKSGEAYICHPVSVAILKTRQ